MVRSSGADGSSTECIEAAPAAAAEMRANVCPAALMRGWRSAQGQAPALNVGATALAAGSIPGWRVNGTRCEGDGLRCRAPLPHGPLPPLSLPVAAEAGGTSQVVVPPMALAFVHVGCGAGLGRPAGASRRLWCRTH